MELIAMHTWTKITSWFNTGELTKHKAMRRKPGERENANARTWGDACAPRLQPRSATSPRPTHAPGPLQGTLPGPANELLGLTRRSCHGGREGTGGGGEGLAGGSYVAAEMSAPRSPAGAGLLLPTRFLAGSRGPGAGTLGLPGRLWHGGTGVRRAQLGSSPGAPMPLPSWGSRWRPALFRFLYAPLPGFGTSPGPGAPRSPGQRPGAPVDPAPAELPVSPASPPSWCCQDLSCLVVLVLRLPCSDLMVKEQPQVMFLWAAVIKGIKGNKKPKPQGQISQPVATSQLARRGERGEGRE